jgi:hypothetical protein
MSGPGWMPSRPRPLPRSPRGLLAFTPGYVRRRRARRQAAPEGTAREPVALSLFERAPVALPTATLLPPRSEARHRVLRELRCWLAPRWAWVRPRAVPIVAAVLGMFAVISVENYLSALARGKYAPPQVCKFETASVDIIDLRPADECGGVPLRKWTFRICNTTHVVVGCP